MIYIARNRNVLTHSFFRVLGPGDSALIPEGDLPGFINGLVSAKGHKQLVSAMEGCRCLLLNTRGSAKQPKRMLTANECIDELQRNYVPANGHKLAQEMYMLSPKQLRANSSKESPAVAFDAYSCDFIGILKQMDPETKNAIEPAQSARGDAWHLPYFSAFRLTTGRNRSTTIQNAQSSGISPLFLFHSPKLKRYRCRGGKPCLQRPKDQEQTT